MEKLDLDEKYVFAVCTYGDSPCIALEELEQLVESCESKLSAGFAVRMPYN